MECTPCCKNEAQEAAKLLIVFIMLVSPSFVTGAVFCVILFFALLADHAGRGVDSVSAALRCWSPNMAMCGMSVVSMVLLSTVALPCTLCTPKVQGLKNNEKYLALSFGEVVALGTFAPCKTGTCGRFLRTIT